jgi:hypothetical protein
VALRRASTPWSHTVCLAKAWMAGASPAMTG